MFKIESYITSIILANADRYIRNFRKEDAQVSLWGGDATFHNIDLNVDALNEEFTSFFVFTSGYIRDLNIHVPWTKLMSEPVTISVNTIECVMRLRAKDERTISTKQKTDDSAHSELIYGVKKISEEIAPSSSYTSALTTKIMNNLSIRCENIILKLVEEDIVFSMNIEKLSFENVNEQWLQTITDINSEKLLTRKLLTLSGVTICLDKQNSSGRIDTYLEPLLYRCLIHIRLLRGYNRLISKKPIYTHTDILSDKMSFTICEPQLSMLYKLGVLLSSTNRGDSSNDEENVCSSESIVSNIESDVGLENYSDGHEETWSNWLWSMMPSILPQDNEGNMQCKEEVNPTFNIGFYVKQLELNLKMLSYSSKKKSKKDFKNFLNCNFYECCCQMLLKNNEWFNAQMGVSHVYVEICDEADCENQTIQIFAAGTANTTSFLEDTLFNEKFDFFALKMHQNLCYNYNDDMTTEISEAFKYSQYDFMYSIDFSVETHLNLCTENFLLEKTPAFAIDYVKTKSKSNTVLSNTTNYRDENFENLIFDDGTAVDYENLGTSSRYPEDTSLLRFVFGSSVVKINPEAVARIMYLHKVIPYNKDFLNYQPSSSGIDEKKITQTNSVNSTIQFTFFDLFVELYPSTPPNFFTSSSCRKENKFFDIPETYSFCHVTPTLNFYCKCIDGSIKYNQIAPSVDCDENAQIISLKAVDISVSTQLTNQKYTTLKCEKFDGDIVQSSSGLYREFKFETKNVKFTSSKPNLLLSFYIVKYLTCFLRQTEAKQKYYTNIFCTSLLDDLVLPYHTVLEAVVKKVNISLKTMNNTLKVTLSIDQCQAFANKMDDDGQKRVIIFSSNEPDQESSSLEVMLQRCMNCNESCNYPSCVTFNLRNLKICLDFIVYQWLLYVPILNLQRKSLPKITKNIRETPVLKSAPSRKVSDASSGSHGRKYSTAYPKPRESVHSSSEPEVHSQLEVTETETSDLFETADSIPIVEDPVQTLTQKIADNVKEWCGLLIFGEISEIVIYVPAIQSVYADACADLDLSIRQSLQNNAGPESNFGIFKLRLKSLKVKCDLSTSVVEGLNSDAFVVVSRHVEPANKLTFPWTVSLTDVSVCTLLENEVCQPLLKPLSINSTLGVSFRDGRKEETVITLCVHFDFQPVMLCFTAEQIMLVTSLCIIFRNICQIYAENTLATSLAANNSVSTYGVENSDIANVIKFLLNFVKSVIISWKTIPRSQIFTQLAHEKGLIYPSVVWGDDKTICNSFVLSKLYKFVARRMRLPQYYSKPLKECTRNRLTGWIQWTFNKCSLELYSSLKDEHTRLSMQAEDSIISLEFDEIFHKLKLKVASFGIYHQTKCNDAEFWESGPYYGVIVQRCHRQSPNSGKAEEDESEDRFLLATITRARSSNLTARLSLSPDSITPTNGDSYVTEIVLKLCPLDLIFPLTVLDKFLLAVKPFISFWRSPGHIITTTTDDSGFDTETSIAYLPLVYFDVPMLRIFVPILTSSTANQTPAFYDTLVCEVGSIQAHCHPENPIVRKPLNPDVYYSISVSKYAPVEQKLQGQQYQINIVDTCVNAAIWNEIQQMLIKEQSSAENPPSIMEQNPAVMWNQGCHPDSQNQIDLKYLSPIIAKFSSLILIAPPVECNFLKAAIYGAYFEVDVITEMNITLSVQQIPFFVSLCNEYVHCIMLHFQSSGKKVVDSTTILMRNNLIPSRLFDSGIESMEQSSVGSSTISKMKNASQSPQLRERSANTINNNISCSSHRLPASTFKKEVFREVYATAKNIRLTIYKTFDKEDSDTRESLYGALIYSEILHPHLLLSDENNSLSVRVGVFSAATYIPSVPYRSLHLSEVPNEKKFYTKFLCVRPLKSDRYSKIKNEGFTLKISPCMNKKWKIDFILDQPLFVDCDVTVIEHLINVVSECVQEYEKRPFTLQGNSNKESTVVEKRSNSEYINRIRAYFNCVSVVQLQTNRIVSIFKSKNTDRGLFLNVDSTKIDVRSPHNIKSSVETIIVQCQLNAIAVSLPSIRNRPYWSNVLSYNQFTPLGFEKEEILATLVVKPWNLSVDYSLMWQRWNLCKENPWKRVKIACDVVHLYLNPSYLNTFTEILSSYTKYFADLKANREDGHCSYASEIAEIVPEFYKDDLRAGAFQYIKREHDERDLSPYEVVFCNRSIQPYVCWKYPQPRKLTRLQIYPVPVQDVTDDYLEHCLRCQLQYFSEISNTFHPYVSFNLSESTIQNVTLPDEKPHVAAAECWRIVIFEVVHPDDIHDFKIDVKLLAGCVRVDSVFQPSLIADVQILLNISEIQLNFSVMNDLKDKMIDNYFVLPSPEEQLFLSVICNDINALTTNYDSEKTIKISGTGKANLLNYEYLMLQSFIDSFSAETVLYIDEDSVCRLACIVKNLHLRVSPNFIHTLTVARNLWNDWRPETEWPWNITAPYIICNNMSNSIILRQENTPNSLQLLPFYCCMFAWSNPTSPKMLILSVLSGKKEFVSEAFSIKRIGCHAVTCSDKDGELCLLFVSVVKHSAVVRQVIVQGSFLIWNLTNLEMDLCIVSGGKERKNKLTMAHVVSKTSISKHQLSSMFLPLYHKLSFKIRYGSNSNDTEQGLWSGLIPFVNQDKPGNQTSWMVKIPLKNHKEHFQSFWCQLTRETADGLPKYLVVFRPLCFVTSYLPWKIHVKLLNDLSTVINSIDVSDRGMSTDMFVPDTVSLNNYTIELATSENPDKCLSRMKFPQLERRKSVPTELSIPSLLDEIIGSTRNNDWPFLNMDTTRIKWKTNQIYDIKPIVKISREEEHGCGTKIEIFPWAIFVNTFSHPVLWNISDVMYTVDCCEIISPPCIEGTFKLGLKENDENFLSGTLQLADDQSFIIPKVTGRIPMNGFVTTMIDCNDFVTFLNITSRSFKDTRIINTCSSYVINNNSNAALSYSAWVICRSSDKMSTSFDIPSTVFEKSINLTANYSATTGQSISKWYKIGNGDVQVLPYLILSFDGIVACPVRICDLSEKQRYPVIFSSTSYSRHKNLPCLFITAQQCDGQVFLTIWKEETPSITIHNTSQLSLNVISSKSEKGTEGISYFPDWNWKFCVAAESSAHFHINRQISENKKNGAFLLFSVESSKPLKQMKWSFGVPLKPCKNQLVTLPLSQRHIKLAIFRDGFTYVVWIKSATADEVSAKMIRNRLSESFLPVTSGVMPSSTPQEDTIIQTENDHDVPDALVKLYSDDALKFGNTKIVINELTLTLACDDENSFEENDVVSFNAKNLFFHFCSLRKPNEVTEEFLCKIDVESYQVLNEEYHLRTFDFPVILVCKPCCDERVRNNYVLENLFLASYDKEDTALSVQIACKIRHSFRCDFRDFEFLVNSCNVYLEDKYVLKLRTTFESIFSASIETSVLIKKPQSPPANRPTSKLDAAAAPITVSTEREIAADVSPAKAKSSSSKSVNVSECGTDNSFKSSIAPESQPNDDHVQKLTPFDSVSEINVSGQRAQTSPNVGTSCCAIPRTIVELSARIAKPLQMRTIYISSFGLTISLRTSTTFYIALDRSPLKFSQFKKEYLVTTPFELGNLLVVHYFMGAVYGTGWAIGSLEFVGSPGVLARDLGTGIKDFVSMPLYGITTGPRGFVLGVAHGSASLMKHVMTGTLSSVTNFAGSWARTLNRFTLDADDLLQAEQIRRMPPSNIVEGILQGLSEFGISILGGISGIAHHPLQYAISNTSNRSLLNSISLGIVGVLTRPISGAAELVARTGQGILSHVGWNMIPATYNGSRGGFKPFSTLQICDLKYRWSVKYCGLVFVGEAVDAQNLSTTLWLLVTGTSLHVIEAANDCERCRFDLAGHEFKGSEQDPTLIVVERPVVNVKHGDDFSKARIYKFINDTNRCLNIETFHQKENVEYVKRSETIISLCVNPRVKNSLLNIIQFLKNIQD